MKRTDWSMIHLMASADQMTEKFEEIVSELTEKHFPLVRVRKRSNESPWITRHIRRLWKRKIRAYNKEGKSEKYWEIERTLQEQISSSREAFVERMLEEGNSGKSSYAATRRLASAGASIPWSVKDVFPDKNSSQACQEVLDYFGGIAREGEPLRARGQVPGGPQRFDAERTATIIGKVKKSDSMVKGDPLPNLVRGFPSAFAEPVAAIYNAINDLGEWPANWKTEYLTVIPKIPNPADLSGCRNISCTSIFSKILEGEVPLQLRSELLPDPDHFGGVPKCGAEHLLVELWERILDALESGTDAAVLLGVDYKKAFNRMDHNVCLNKLEDLGASRGSVSLVAAFLKGRKMTIRIDSCTATPIPIVCGSPQGSVLGCLLYCATTQLLTVGLRADRTASPRFFPQDSSDNEGAIFWEDDQGQCLLPATYLYVDDTTLFDVVRLASATTHLTTAATIETLGGIELGKDFEELSGRADAIGMRINQKKTQLLVISPPNGCDTVADFTVDGVTTSSVDSL